MAPPASPAIRKIARELDLDLTRVRGSEAGGRINMADLRAYVRKLQDLAFQNPAPAAPVAAPSPASRPTETIDFAKWGPIRREKMSPLRRTVSRRMVESWTSIPKINQFADADITALLALRKKHAPAYEKNGTHLTLTSFILFILGRALKNHPRANASIGRSIAGDRLQRLLPHRRCRRHRRRLDRASAARCRQKRLAPALRRTCTR